MRLYIRHLRSGSIIAELQAIAEQAQILFGEHGIFQTTKDFFDHAKTLAGFATHLNEIVLWFLGLDKERKSPSPTKKETANIIDFFEPVARDSSSNLTIQVNGPVHIQTATFNYNSQQANAVQNTAKRYLGPTLPGTQTRPDEVLVLHQVRGVATAKAGDKGIIESLTKQPIKLVFASDKIKKEILDLPENPFQQAFLVDVDVKTVDGKPALYKILNLKDSFEKP